MDNVQAWQQEIDRYDISQIDAGRLQQLINIVERVKGQDRAFEMGAWQKREPWQDIAQTESELQRCGRPASMGGWVAVSPEFQAAGGTLNFCGAPVYDDVYCYISGMALYAWLMGETMPGRKRWDHILWGHISSGGNIGDYLTGDGQASLAETIVRLEYIREKIANA